MNNALLRALPKVDDLLRRETAVTLCAQYGNIPVREAVRQEIAALREGILRGRIDVLPGEDELLCAVEAHVFDTALPSFRRVINGTGVILHTNLGRACLSDKAVRAVYDAARGYSNLEYDLENGSRGSRYSHVEPLLCRLTGAESALVVNNNAAAVLLILSALTAGGEVPVSRGELVEIGGAFRVPEIMESCGAKLREVGATNKTHLYDYERAINSETKALMKVHTSNYRIIGFSETPALSELVELGHRHGLPVLEDLGSGCLVDLNIFGIHDEPTVQESLRAGVDVVSFSGDKLLGGPQAGIILGKKKYLDILKKHPLNRAMRVDKMTLAALEATLQSYEAQRAEEEVPVIAMLAADKATLKAKAAQLCSLLREAGIPCECVATEGRVGGGSVPGQSLPSFAAAMEGRVDALEEKLRKRPVPIIGRIHEGRWLLDVRTLRDEDFSEIAEALKEAMA
ncbi:MAG: L-seryl-tRNA(Sec) selenium transferase [Ruminococcaceae bacterium]|nr:L-seryl-tRNA(Sec) selenium transferase [Oscillospiraceae bacterium]